jgi:hypothetical protein
MAGNARQNARTRGKVWEREVATKLGTKRTGPTGMDDSDVIHDTLGIECKAYKRIAFKAADWDQTVRNAKGRIPILAIKELNTGKRIVFMEFDYFVALHQGDQNG